MKKMELVMIQGDVLIYRIDEFPEGARSQDELTEKGQLALGEISGHNHAFRTPADISLFKIDRPEYNGLSFFEVKRPTVLEHGRIKDFIGEESDLDYHSMLTLKEGNYISSVVEETDWLTRTVRKVID